MAIGIRFLYDPGSYSSEMAYRLDTSIIKVDIHSYAEKKAYGETMFYKQVLLITTTYFNPDYRDLDS